MTVIKIKKIVLLVGDIILLYVALFITLKLRYLSSFDNELWLRHVTPFTILFMIWIVVFYINNLYSIQLVKNDFRFYTYLIQNLVINMLIGFTFFYLAPPLLTTSLKPFRVLIVLILVFSALLFLWRRLYYLLTSSKTLANNLLFIGMNTEAAELAREIQRNPQLGYKIGLIIDLDHRNTVAQELSVPCYRELTGLHEIIKQYRVQTVVTVGDSQHNPNVSRYLFETLGLGLSYFTFPNFYERLTGKVPVASLEERWFIENLLGGQKLWYEIGKRLQDIIFSIIFGIISLPLLPIIIGGIKLSSTGPILFRQERTGKGGKIFTAMKFRTMVTNAEQHGPQWASKNDPRITNFGKFLRKTRLDEIPQFINIVRGDMSFVGPRPERPAFVAELTTRIPFYKERLLVNPGLTGWAQINFKYGESIEDAMTKLQYDLFYIKNRSFALDISIILKTISIVLNASFGQ